MTVHFIGAGPGDPELITVRGQRLIRGCPLVLYAGSLVPVEVVEEAAEGARVLDTAPMTLDQIMEEIETAHKNGQDVARVHSGDPSIYGAIGEQIRRLRAADIDYDITPGVPAFAAAAALLGTELTLPDVSQTIILTRTTMRSSAMPAGEDLATLARSGATLAIHLSIRNMREVCATLRPQYGDDCPVAVVFRASWPDELVIHGTLGNIEERVRPHRLRRTALIMVGRVLDGAEFTDSRLYASDHFHLLRPKKRAPKG
ncbi:MAG: precorrin-4 C(11)-methyltransferase [Chromatiales bacterium]|jgi:precorrin-4/cobalt-precorrin-4 C11-methyltransferase|nr:precorrin-4 C(11)-methyltransferase [Chromatiales bacterium]